MLKILVLVMLVAESAGSAVPNEPLRADFFRDFWFLGLLALLVIAAGIQTRRVFVRGRKLASANVALEAARSDLERRVRLRTSELLEVNQHLQQEMYERKQAEQELVRFERLRALMDLSEGVSHNLNNMLTGIMGPAELLQMTTNDVGQKQYVDMILRSARRAAELVRRLRTAVDIDKDDALGPIDVTEAIRDALVVTRPRWKDDVESRGIAIEVMTNLPEMPEIMGQRPEFQDVLRNLIFNAIDAMPKGGTLEICSTVESEWVVLVVSDTGVGMDESVRERIFEPFFTTKMDVGSGLGLSVVHGTLLRWGATIEVESAPGNGSVFTLRLPVWISPQKDDTHSSLDQVPRSQVKKRILVADDEDVVVNIIASTLSGSHEIIVSYDGATALLLFENRGADIALLDLSMPELSGDQVAQKIKEVDPTVVTVLVTGWTLEEEDSRLEPFDFVVNKPFENLDVVRDVVGRAVALHESRVQDHE